MASGEEGDGETGRQMGIKATSRLLEGLRREKVEVQGSERSTAAHSQIHGFRL